MAYFATTRATSRVRSRFRRELDEIWRRADDQPHRAPDKDERFTDACRGTRFGEMTEQAGTIAERVARNQATFRDANERIEQTALGMSDVADPLPFICECLRRDCTELTRLSRREYERVRSDGRQFFVVPGHEICELDGVVIAEVLERQEFFSVLRKVGEAGEIAAELDARK